ARIYTAGSVWNWQSDSIWVAAFLGWTRQPRAVAVAEVFHQRFGHRRTVRTSCWHRDGGFVFHLVETERRVCGWCGRDAGPNGEAWYFDSGGVCGGGAVLFAPPFALGRILLALVCLRSAAEFNSAVASNFDFLARFYGALRDR